MLFSCCFGENNIEDVSSFWYPRKSICEWTYTPLFTNILLFIELLIEQLIRLNILQVSIFAMIKRLHENWKFSDLWFCSHHFLYYGNRKWTTREANKVFLMLYNIINSFLHLFLNLPVFIFFFFFWSITVPFLSFFVFYSLVMLFIYFFNIIWPNLFAGELVGEGIESYVLAPKVFVLLV